MINNLKDLEKLIRLCQKLGVDEFEQQGLKLKFKEAPIHKKPNISPAQFIPGGVTEETRIQTNTLSPDDLLFYSVSNQHHLMDTDNN